MSRPGIEATLEELIGLRAVAAGLATGKPRASREPTGGTRRSPFRGRGMEYAESRPYAPGDDVRHIDWRVTARSGRVHSKLFQPERDRITAIVVDRSPAMAFGTRGCFKRVQAARLGALLAWLALADGDRLCAASFGAGGDLQPPSHGRHGVLRVLEALVAGSRGEGSERPVRGLADTLDRLGRVLRPGSHVLLLLDPRSVDDDSRLALGRLRAHHDLVAALLADPIELAPPPPARYPIAANGVRRLLALDEAAAREAWSAHFAALHHGAERRLTRSGVRARIVRTDDDPVQALRALLHGRTQRQAVA